MSANERSNGRRCLGAILVAVLLITLVVLDLVSPDNKGDSVALVGYTLHYACEE